MPSDSAGGSIEVLAQAIAKQEAVLKSMLALHGEFNTNLSEDMAQLALLYNMNGEYDKALQLLHKRLVIHEKYGPEELVGETLQSLGTVYRLKGVHKVALQLLERALTVRERCHGKDSYKVAETLNSLALLAHCQQDSNKAEEFQSRSLQVLFQSSEPEDIESEDVPWEVYKRLKQQRGPSTAQNSVTLFKGNMRKCVIDAIYDNHVQNETLPSDDPSGEQRGFFFCDPATTTNRDFSRCLPRGTSLHNLVAKGRLVRCLSDSCMLRYKSDIEEFGTRISTFALDPNDEQAAVVVAAEGSRTTSPRGTGDQMRSQDDSMYKRERESQSLSRRSSMSSSRNSTYKRLTNDIPIIDFVALKHRVENIKLRLQNSNVNGKQEIERFAREVEAIESSELHQVGHTMVALLKEINQLHLQADHTRLPVLEGYLEKKSNSIFRGWEKRFFKVDPKTFALTYHLNKEDYTRGFASRGGFPVSRITNILVHRQPRAGLFHFDVVVDLSTRFNIYGSRTYELRCASEEVLLYWVETLHYYRAMAQNALARSH